MKKIENSKFINDEDYKFIFSKVPRLCIDLIIKSPFGLLLSKRDIAPFKGKWHLPGGMVYKNETLEIALKRIALNELGIVPIIFYIDNYIGQHLHEINMNNIDVHSVAINFNVTAWEIKDKKKWKNKNVKFFVNLPSKLINNAQFFRIKEILNNYININK